MPKQVTVVTGDGASPVLSLEPGENKISIEAATIAATATFIVQTKLDGDGTIWTQHQDPQDSATPAQLDAADAIAGGGFAREFVVFGPGTVRVYGANFTTSTGVVLRAAPSRPK